MSRLSYLKRAGNSSSSLQDVVQSCFFRVKNRGFGSKIKPSLDRIVLVKEGKGLKATRSANIRQDSERNVVFVKISASKYFAGDRGVRRGGGGAGREVDESAEDPGISSRAGSADTRARNSRLSPCAISVPAAVGCLSYRGATTPRNHPSPLGYALAVARF